jgi:hypothetical protein
MKMKFELKPYNRNIPDNEFIKDLQRVSNKLKKDSLSQKEYVRHGKYHSSTISRRFGSWNKALKKAGLQVRKYQIISEQELIEDLKRVSNALKKKSVTHAEYNSYGKFSSSAIMHRFSSWFKALEKAGLEKTRTYGVTDEEYFKNIEEIWIKLGRQPNYAEIEKPFSRYSAGAYERRFGSWRKALEAFIEYINAGEDNNIADQEKVVDTIVSENHKVVYKHKTKRNISWRLRFIIMKRDNFKCQKCGRSPATEPNVRLQVDHMKPWSKGGETVAEILETLCMECNIGKSNLEK